MSHGIPRKKRPVIKNLYDPIYLNTHEELLNFIAHHNGPDEIDYIIPPKYSMTKVSDTEYVMGLLKFKLEGGYLIISGIGDIHLNFKNIQNIPANVIYDNIGHVNYEYNYLKSIPANNIFTKNVKIVDFYMNELKHIDASCQFHNSDEVDLGQNFFIILPAALYNNKNGLFFDHNKLEDISIGAKIYSEFLSIEFNVNLKRLPKNLTFHCKEILISDKDNLLLSTNKIGNSRSAVVYNYNGNLHINLGCFSGSYSQFIKQINQDPNYNINPLNKILLKTRYIFKVRELFEMASLYYSLPIL